MRLTIKCGKICSKKNEKSHSRKLWNQKNNLSRKNLEVLGKIPKPLLHSLHYLAVLMCYVPFSYTEIFSTVDFYRGLFSTRGF